MPDRSQDKSALAATQVVSRFLFLFHYNSALSLSTVLGAGTPESAWSHPEVPKEYLEERAESIWANQFGTVKGQKGAAGYLRMTAEPFADRTFVVASRRNEKDDIRSFRFDDRGIELFAPPGTGVGLLSVTLSASGILSWDSIRDFNYHLSQNIPNKAAVVIRGEVPDSDDQAEFLREARNGYIKREEWKVPFEQRLTAQEFRFTLAELFRWILGPVLALEGTWPRRRPLQVFTAARFPAGVGMTSLDRPQGLPASLDLTGFAAGLCQMEERNHPLPHSGGGGAHVIMLSTHHLAAASTQGSAHLLFDQGIEFDNSRMGYCRDRYFVDYFCAAAMQGRLQNLSQLARELAMRRGKGVKETVEQLFHDTAIFLSRSDLLEVSYRDAHNRYFTLCKDAFNTEQYLQLVQRTIGDLNSGLAAQRQVDIGETANATQSKVEWIEVFIVSIYAFEVAERLGERMALSHTYVTAGSVGILLMSFGLALYWVRPFEHSKRNMMGSLLAKTLVASLLLGGYLAAGVLFFRPPPDHSTEWSELKRRATGIPVLEARVCKAEAAQRAGAEVKAVSGEVASLTTELDSAERARRWKEEAESVCGEACRDRKPSVNGLMAQGLRDWQAGQFAESAKAYEAVVKEVLALTPRTSKGRE